MENYLVFIVAPIPVGISGGLLYWLVFEKAKNRVGRFGENVIWYPTLLAWAAAVFVVMADQVYPVVGLLIGGILWLALSSAFVVLTRPDPRHKNRTTAFKAG